MEDLYEGAEDADEGGESGAGEGDDEDEGDGLGYKSPPQAGVCFG